MSEFDLGFGHYGALGDADTDAGTQVLQQFQNAMQNLYGSSYTLSFDDLKNKYDSSLLDGLGIVVNSGMSLSDTNTAMKTLASVGAGAIPSSSNGFFQALQGQAANVSSWSVLSQAAGATLDTVTNGFVDVGSAITSTGGVALQTLSYAKYLIYAVPFVLIWVGYKNRDDLGKAASASAIKLGNAATGGLIGLGHKMLHGKKVESNPRRKKRRK